MLPHIPYKLYARMTDMAEDLYQEFMTNGNTPVLAKMDVALVTFQEEIRWPWRASPEQINDWNAKHLFD